MGSILSGDSNIEEYITGWWFGTFFIFHIHGIILPID
jgi:hypothetical protein